MTARRSYRDHVFVWDRKFETRQKQAYRAEESNLRLHPDSSTITAFLHEQRSRLDPPDYNYVTLRAFLEQARDIDLIKDPPMAPDNRIIALLDERRDPTGWLDIFGDHHPARDWEGYASQPPEGEHRPMLILNACDLYRNLQTSRQATGAERRIIYLADMSPLAGLALASSSSSLQAPILRDFLERYLSNRVYFGVAMVIEPFGFAMEFHLPYYALRQSHVACTDRRHLRRHGEFITRRMPGQKADFLYEAQISVLVTGVDEWFWTTYCCVDTYFGSEETIQFYHERRLDAPTGGLKPAHFPVWNPREYFLLILSRRFRQITKEWGNVVNTLERRLQYHEERVFNEAKQRSSLIDDAELNRTREYTWTIELLRLLHNTLVKIVESWENFEHAELRYFEVKDQGATHIKWSNYLAEIEKDLTELRFLRRCLQQRIEMFDNMRNGLVKASAMVESRVATLQGKNIARLTRVTVAYLPLSLGTAIFSMVMIPDRGSWTAYALVLIILLALTLTIVFQSQILFGKFNAAQRKLVDYVLQII